MRNNSLAVRPARRARETTASDISLRSQWLFSDSDESKWLHIFQEENVIARMFLFYSPEEI